MHYITFYKGELGIPQSVLVADKKKFEKYIRKAYEVNRKFWKTNMPIRIKPTYSRADFNRECGYATRKWNCAMTNDNEVIIIFAPSVFEQLTNHKLSSYLQTLTHEINHIFYHNFVGTYKPVWLSEGLAMYVAKQGEKYKGKINSRYLRYSFTPKDFEESDESARQYYRNSYLFTRLLIKKKGVQAIMNFLRSYRKQRTEKAYNVLYKKLRSK